LVRLANERGGEDNITVLIASFSGDGVPGTTEDEVSKLLPVIRRRWWWFWPWNQKG